MSKKIILGYIVAFLCMCIATNYTMLNIEQKRYIQQHKQLSMIYNLRE